MPPIISPDSRIERLFKLYCADMYRVAYSILRTHQDAEDAVQEAFVRIEQNLPKIPEPASPRTRAFVLVVVRNTAINMAHRQSREIPAEISEILPSGYSAEETVIAQIGAEQLFEAIHLLPENYRSILYLTAVENYSLREAAQLLGISYANAKSRTLRARKRLRRILSEQGYE